MIKLAKKIKLKCPDWFNEFSIKEWKRITKILKSEEINFSDKDIKALEAYCSSYGTWRDNVKIIKEKGYTFITPNGYEQQRPEVSISNKAQQEMRHWMKELCLTPASRARANKNKASSTEYYSEDDHKMEKLLND